MALSLPSIRAEGAHRTVTLADLRDLVEATGHLSGETIVRGNAIPFHVADLGNPLGGRLMTLALDEPDPPDAPGEQ